MLGNIAGMSEAIKSISKLTGVMDRIMNDSGIKEKFENTGKISGAFSMEGYRVNFTLEKEIKEIEAVEE